MAEATRVEKMRGRLRILLVVAIVLLVLLLIALGILIIRVVSPVAPPESADMPEGLEWVRSIYGYGPSAEEQLRAPNDAAVAPDGTVWVTDGQRSRVLAFSPDGTYTKQIYQGEQSVAEGRLYRPDAIDINDEGDVFIADYGTQRITVFTQENEFLREWPIQAPLEVAVRDGRVVVGTRYGVGMFTEDGEVIGQFGELGNGPEEFDGVRGVAIAEDGTMYFSDTHNKRVKAYTPEGELLWISPPEQSAAELSSDATETAGDSESSKYPSFQLPVGMTIDGSGRLVVLDAFGFSMVVLDSDDGRLLDTYGAFGQEDGLFVYPTGIDYDEQRDWFAVADTSNDRAQVLRIPGTGGSALATARRIWEGPFRFCAIPLLLLLLAVIVLVSRRRRSN